MYCNDTLYIHKKITNKKQREDILKNINFVKTEDENNINNLETNVVADSNQEYAMIQNYKDMNIEDLVNNKKAEMMLYTLKQLTKQEDEPDFESERKEIESVLETLIPSDKVITFNYSGVSGDYIKPEFFSIVYIEGGDGFNLGFFVHKAIANNLFKRNKINI